MRSVAVPVRCRASSSAQRQTTAYQLSIKKNRMVMGVSFCFLLRQSASELARPLCLIYRFIHFSSCGFNGFCRFCGCRPIAADDAEADALLLMMQVLLFLRAFHPAYHRRSKYDHAGADAANQKQDLKSFYNCVYR